MSLLIALNILSVLCEGSNYINTTYEKSCQSYYISCDKEFICQLQHSELFDMEPSPIERF